MNKVSTIIAIAAATLATAGIASGPAFAASPTPASTGQSSTSQSNLSWNLPDGQGPQQQVVTAVYNYDIAGYNESIHTVYHLKDGATWTVDATGHPSRINPRLMDFTTGTATYVQGNQTASYTVTGGGFGIDPSAGKAEQVAMFDMSNHGIDSSDF
jgi:hypothetical protein